MIHDPAALGGTQRRELRPSEEVALQGSRDPKLHWNDALRRRRDVCKLL